MLGKIIPVEPLQVSYNRPRVFSSMIAGWCYNAVELHGQIPMGKEECDARTQGPLGPSPRRVSHTVGSKGAVSEEKIDRLIIGLLWLFRAERSRLVASSSLEDGATS